MLGDDVNLVDPQELWFLILHHLSASPVSSFVAPLESALRTHGLVPERFDIFGTAEPYTYAQLADQYKHIPPSHLQNLLSRYNRLRDEHTPGVKGLHSLLLKDDDVQSPARASSRKVKLQPQRRGLHFGAPLPCQLLLQETGQSVYSSRCGALFSDKSWCGRLRHQRTFRGHTSPVYLVTSDRYERYIITGADDCIVKIWSMTTGVLLMTCRGHEGEITDLKISCDCRYIASSATDNVIRVWSLEATKLGHPVSVLTGCEKMLSFLDWNPVVPNVLASVSLDGTCRIWDAKGSSETIILRPSATFGHLSGATMLSTRALRAAAGVDPVTGMPAQQNTADGMPAGEPFELLSCAWSADGVHLVAGGNDCTAYMWHWDLSKVNGMSLASLQNMNAFERMNSGLLTEIERKDWPVVHELCKLDGHRNNIRNVKFSRNGWRLATGSMDGTIRIFGPTRRAHNGGKVWREVQVLSCTPAPTQPGGIRRKKVVDKIPTVQQMEWSLDDSLVMVALSDQSIRVFNARSGAQLRCLTGHTKDLYEIACHPKYPNVLASWAYDGMLYIWDISTGQRLRQFSTHKTYPGRGIWCDNDPISLLDGHWNASGTKIFTTDIAGQLHIFGLGAADLMARANYDQFWKADYGELARDANGWVIDTASNRQPHINPDKRVMDLFQIPYEEPYQSLSAHNRLSQGVAPRNWNKGACPRSVLTAPPINFAAEFHVRANNGGDVAVQNAVERAVAAQDELMDRVAAGAVMLSDDEEPVESLAGVLPRDAVNAGRAPPGMSRQPSHPANRSAAAQRSQRADFTMVPNAAAAPSDDEVISSSDNDANDATYMDSGSDQDLLQAVGTRRQGSRRAGGDQDLVAMGSSESDVLSDDDEGEGDWDSSERDRGGGRRRRSRASGSDTSRRVSSRRVRQPTQRMLESIEEPVRRSSRSAAQHRSGYLEDSDDMDYEAMVDLDEDNRRERKRRERAARLEQRAQRRSAAARGEGSRKRKKKKNKRQTQERQARGGHTSSQGTWRKEENYHWLQSCDPLLAFYVPQIDDKVVYCRDAHVKHLEDSMDKLSTPGHLQITVSNRDRHGSSFRPFEPCKVTNIEYLISNDGNNYTLARLTLVLREPQHPALANQPFRVDVPPPCAGHAEFVVLQSRFEHGCLLRLSVGDRIKTYQILENSLMTAQGYVGRIISNRLEGTALEAHELWDEKRLLNCYEVEWEGGDEAASAEALSPWEVYDLDHSERDLLRSLKGDAPAVRTACDRLAAACKAAIHEERVPDSLKILPAQNERFGVGRSDRFYTQHVPLPTALYVLLGRAEGMYYRSRRQLLKDVHLFKANSVNFWSPQHEVGVIARRVYRHIMAELHGEGPQQLATVLDADTSADEDDDRYNVDISSSDSDDGDDAPSAGPSAAAATSAGAGPSTRPPDALPGEGAGDAAAGPSTSRSRAAKRARVSEDGGEDEPDRVRAHGLEDASGSVENGSHGRSLPKRPRGTRQERRSVPNEWLGAAARLYSGGSADGAWPSVAVAGPSPGGGTGDQPAGLLGATPDAVYGERSPRSLHAAAAGPSAAASTLGGSGLLGAASTPDPAADESPLPRRAIRIKRRLPEASAADVAGTSSRSNGQENGINARSLRARGSSDRADARASSPHDRDNDSRERRRRGGGDDAPAERSTRRARRAVASYADMDGGYGMDEEEDELTHCSAAQLRHKCTRAGIEVPPKASKAVMLAALRGS